MSKFQIPFHDPDLVNDIINEHCENFSEKQTEKFTDTYFQDSEYGVIEINPKTLECKLLPCKKWNS